MQRYVRLLNMPQLFDALIVSALLGVAMFIIFGALSKLVVGRWYEPTT
jgi:NitT/TauT family transport system permease protein